MRVKRLFPLDLQAESPPSRLHVGHTTCLFFPVGHSPDSAAPCQEVVHNSKGCLFHLCGDDVSCTLGHERWASISGLMLVLLSWPSPPCRPVLGSFMAEVCSGRSRACFQPLANTAICQLQEKIVCQKCSHRFFEWPWNKSVEWPQPSSSIRTFKSQNGRYLGQVPSIGN